MADKNFLEENNKTLIKQCEKLEKESRQLKDYIMILRKNNEEYQKKNIILQDENLKLIQTLKEETLKNEILEKNNEELIAEQKIFIEKQQEISEKLLKYKEIFQFISTKAKPRKESEGGEVNGDYDIRNSPVLLRANSSILPQRKVSLQKVEENLRYSRNLENDIDKFYHKSEYDSHTFSPKKFNNSQFFVDEENHLKPKTDHPDLYASKRTEETTYFENNNNNQPSFIVMKDSGLEHGDSNIKISEMQPYNKINDKMQNFFIKKTSFADPQTDSVKLFEEFLILGVDKSEIEKKTIFEDPKQKINEEAIVQYNYPNSDDEIQTARRNLAPNFTFPFGIDLTKIRLSKSMSHFHEIIFLNNVNELNGNCFVFVLKPDEKLYKTRKNRIKNEFLKSCNSEMLLYCICYIAKDYISVKSENRKKIEFFSTKKAYCFMTYFPFFSFFLEIIVSFLNKMKLKRMEILNQPENLSEIDSDFFYKSVRFEVEKSLEKIRQYEIPTFGKTLKLSFSNEETLNLYFPELSVCVRQEALWGGFYALSNLTLENFLFLYLAMLLENSIAFFSSNCSLLSSSLLIFHNLLKPFSWLHPMIFNLPKCFLQIFDSPVPFLAGINKPFNFVIENNILENYPYVICVDLDNGGAKYFEKLSNYVPLKTIKSLMDEMKMDWEYLEKFKQKNNNINNPKNKEESIFLPIFNLIDNFVTINIVSILPKKHVFVDKTKKILDFQSIEDSLIKLCQPTHREFIQNLMKTQLFTVFLEDYYDFSTIS